MKCWDGGILESDEKKKENEKRFAIWETKILYTALYIDLV